MIVHIQRNDQGKDPHLDSIESEQSYRQTDDLLLKDEISRRLTNLFCNDGF
jgi:hypothetical protein